MAAAQTFDEATAREVRVASAHARLSSAEGVAVVVDVAAVDVEAARAWVRAVRAAHAAAAVVLIANKWGLARKDAEEADLPSFSFDAGVDWTQAAMDPPVAADGDGSDGASLEAARAAAPSPTPPPPLPPPRRDVRPDSSSSDEEEWEDSETDSAEEVVAIRRLFGAAATLARSWARPPAGSAQRGGPRRFF